MMKKHIFWVVVFFVPLCLNSCNKDGDETISLEYQMDGQSGGSDSGNSALDDVMPSKYQKDLTDHGMPIYSGNNPPNVEGCFYVNPALTVWDSEGGWGDRGPAYVRLSNQKGNKLTYELTQYPDNGYEKSVDARIVGSGNNFTVYFKGVGATDGISHTTVTVLSGTMDRASGGVRNAYSSYTLISKGADPSGILVKVGGSRIIRDGDRWSPFANWPL